MLAGVGCRIHRLPLCRKVTLPQRVSCSPVGRGSRIHQLYFCRRIRPPSECPVAQSAGSAEYKYCISLNECHGYDTKQSDGKFPLMIELYRVQSTLSLPLLLAPICSQFSDTPDISSLFVLSGSPFSVVPTYWCSDRISSVSSTGLTSSCIFRVSSLTVSSCVSLLPTAVLWITLLSLSNPF